MFRTHPHHRRFGRSTAVMVGGGALGLGYGMAAALAPLPAAAAEETLGDDSLQASSLAPITADPDLLWTSDLTIAVEITPLRDQPEQIDKAAALAEDPELVTTDEVSLRARPSDGADSLATLDDGTELGADSDPETENGYTLVYTADGVTGYVRSEFLTEFVAETAAAVDVSTSVEATDETATDDTTTDDTATDDAAAPVATSGGVVGAALSREGATYGYGGTGPWLFDCSGLVAWSYAQIGKSLPHSSGSILNAGTVISAAEAQPGDVIWSPGHVSIYLGGDQQMEAVGPGRGIHQTRIWQNSPVFLRF